MIQQMVGVMSRLLRYGAMEGLMDITEEIEELMEALVSIKHRLYTYPVSLVDSRFWLCTFYHIQEDFGDDIDMNDEDLLCRIREVITALWSKKEVRFYKTIYISLPSIL